MTEACRFIDKGESIDLELEGRTALVIGASSGLGLASAEALRGDGANIVMFARREELLRREAGRGPQWRRSAARSGIGGNG